MTTIHDYSQEEMVNSEEEVPPPRRTPRAKIWVDVPEAQWTDWRWQLSHRLNSLDELRQILRLTPEEEAGIQASDRLRLDITPYFASLIDPDDPNCPIRRQVIPTIHELEGFSAAMEDSLNEEGHSPVPGLVHRYPDRVLMLVTTQCASYCRYCTRSRIVGDPAAQFSRSDYEAQLAYIARTPQIRDVLLSGGDPLILPQRLLEMLLQRLRAIPHVEIIRIGTRVPVFLPQRITQDLVDMLRRFHPLWMNIHFNHPKEITPEVREAVNRLADAGIPLGSQSVLLAGINDCPNIIKRLLHELVKIRVRPYYLYQCDLVEGAGHFRTPVSKGIEIMEALRGHTSGYAIPMYVIDAPGGGGKVPILPQYLISQSPERVVVRNYEGFISTYMQPTNYRPHDPSTCPECQAVAHNQEGVQKGVAALLAGERLAIVPEGLAEIHQRRSSVRETLVDSALARMRGNGTTNGNGGSV
ncbi:MAG: lysine 2,3-aminomutase [Anaerolineae bacterium]|nr:lysine 2,3-aminomutase [Anaerolineae bacterium]MDW8100667.1 lysine 2,3-aminomutase [Anaerolineae bacterium]